MPASRKRLTPHSSRPKNKHVAQRQPNHSPATNGRSTPTHVGPDALVWAASESSPSCSSFVNHSPATNRRSTPPHVGPDALVWAGERKLALLLVNNECTTYFKYSEFFFNSSGTGGNGGNSCEYPLNKLTVFSERLLPSWMAILCTWPSEYPSHNEAPA